MSDEPRCTLVGMSMEDPVASARDPALAALVNKGWRVMAHVPAQRGDRQELLLLMAPPVAPRAVPRAVWWLALAVLALQVVAAVALTTLATTGL